MSEMIERVARALSGTGKDGHWGSLWDIWRDGRRNAQGERGMSATPRPWRIHRGDRYASAAIYGMRDCSIGNYILYALLVLLIMAAALGGGGFESTKMYRLNARISTERTNAASSSSNNQIGMPAFSNVSLINARPISGAALPSRPNTTPVKEFGPVCVLLGATSAFSNKAFSSIEYDHASGLSLWCSINTLSTDALPRMASTIWARCSGETCRHAVTRSISAVRSRASAASFSSLAARSMASDSLSLDRLLRSVWIRLFNIPNKTSPTMPIATAASAMAEAVKNVLYGGSTPAITSSAITAMTTNAPHQIPHHSHDDDAASSWFSAAFIAPFGRYQAGKNSFRTFLLALVVWSLVFGLLFLALA